jgi:hypothetical protein
LFLKLYDFSQNSTFVISSGRLPRHAGETFGFDAYTAALSNDYRFTMYADDPGLLDIWAPAIIISTRLGQEK